MPGSSRSNLLAELGDSVGDHAHGAVNRQRQGTAWNGYLLTVACPRNVVFERWVTLLDAELDLLQAGIVELSPRNSLGSRVPGAA